MIDDYDSACAIAAGEDCIGFRINSFVVLLDASADVIEFIKRLHCLSVFKRVTTAKDVVARNGSRSLIFI